MARIRVETCFKESNVLEVPSQRLPPIKKKCRCVHDCRYRCRQRRLSAAYPRNSCPCKCHLEKILKAKEGVPNEESTNDR